MGRESVQGEQGAALRGGHFKQLYALTLIKLLKSSRKTQLHPNRGGSVKTLWLLLRVDARSSGGLVGGWVG